MQLYYSNTSPYARKTRLVLREKGLESQIEEVLCNPFDPLPALQRANPLHRVPTLVLPDGGALFDSPVICQYLDDLVPEPRLIPSNGPERWDCLRWEALADGILDAAYNIVMERRRPETERSAHWLDAWEREIRAALTGAEQQRDRLPEELRLSQLALGTALGYLDFRLDDLGWRAACPVLNDWFREFAIRPTFQATQPV